MRKGQVLGQRDDVSPKTLWHC